MVVTFVVSLVYWASRVSMIQCCFPAPNEFDLADEIKHSKNRHLNSETILPQVTVQPQVRQTRELARQMGLEICDLAEKVARDATAKHTLPINEHLHHQYPITDRPQSSLSLSLSLSKCSTDKLLTC